MILKRENSRHCVMKKFFVLVIYFYFTIITGLTQGRYEFLTFYVHLQNNLSKSYNL